MIVFSTRVQTGLKQFFLGSTVEQMVRPATSLVISVWPARAGRNAAAMRSRVALAAAVLLAAGCAHGPLSSFVRPRLPSHSELRAAFTALDASGNGGVSFEEWRHEGDRRFWLRDRDGDGYLTKAEISDNALMLELFLQADQRTDGRLERREFGRVRDLIFQDADVTNDSSLVLVEYELLVLLRRSGWKDITGYGRILPAELRALLGKSMSLLDRDGDGVLRAGEREFFAPAHLEVMDPQRTGRLTLDQIYRGYRFLLGFDISNSNL